MYVIYLIQIKISGNKDEIKSMDFTNIHSSVFFQLFQYAGGSLIEYCRR